MLADISPYLLPFIIYFARIGDVTLGTIRITMVSRGFKFAAAALGFFEVLIWVVVVAQLLTNLNHWMNYVAYAAGFATGNYVGLYLEEKLKVGTIIVRIITTHKSEVLVKALKKAGISVTTMDAQGSYGDVKIIFTVLRRKRWNDIISIIRDIDPEAFYSSEDVKFVSKNNEHPEVYNQRGPLNRLLRLRKGI